MVSQVPLSPLGFTHFISACQDFITVFQHQPTTVGKRFRAWWFGRYRGKNILLVVKTGASAVILIYVVNVKVQKFEVAPFRLQSFYKRYRFESSR